MRNTGPVCRLCRRENKKLFLKGTRCNTQKCAFLRKPDVPGKYGKLSMGKKTEYHNQLRCKQAAKRIYGLNEKQFQAYYKEANRLEGNSSDIFQQLLETRLDNAVFRAGFGASRAQARQIVNHGLLQVNGRRATIASMQVKIGDKIEVKKTAVNSPLFEGFAKRKDIAPKWLKTDLAKLSFEVVALPETVEGERIDAQTIIEFYSR
ncbi:MAG: 30S ribosomal protein S4 [Candidatus Gracilibacteria bacterium]